MSLCNASNCGRSTATMLPIARRRIVSSLRAPLALTSRRTYAEHPKSTVAEIPANQPPSNAPPTPNVSETNEVVTSSMGSEDKPLQESVAEAEKMRSMQAPNRKSTWSRSQQPRDRAMVGPRFEQTIIADQVRKPRSCCSSSYAQAAGNIRQEANRQVDLSHNLWQQLSLSTNNQCAGETNELFHAMAVVVLLAIQESS
jgi:hypothetical protein